VKECDPQLYENIVRQLCVLMHLEENGQLNIYYGDESGFSLEPYIPYGWQPAGEYVKIVSETSPRLNVFGILSRDNKMHAYSVTGSVDTDTIIACMDDFVKTIVTKTVLVLDNASIHSSKKFKAKMDEWLEKGLQIFHLPPYSPHLNPIETLWRKVKYEWIKPADYKSWDSLQNAVERILESVGDQHRIKFSEPEFFKKYKASII